MLFDVPFLPDSNYIRFLDEHRKHLNSVYFGLYRTEIMDARHRFRFRAPDDQIRALRAVTGVSKFALVNSRMHHPEGYRDTEKIGLVAEILLRFAKNDVLDGIVFGDAYYLQALSDAAPDLAQGLQAVPSINFMIDSADKLRTILEFIATTHFRPPEKITLDRSLNRNREGLIDVVQWCRRERPQLKIALLGNEGCLYQCPFKPAHDALIACSYMSMNVDSNGINQALGCIRILRKNPEKLFQSPFIRPEDVFRYEGLVDIVKLCGRTLGRGFLEKVVQAYIDGHYSGNLLDLLDAVNWMTDEFYLSNDQLPENFFEQMSHCSDTCQRCNRCREFRNAHMYALEIGFKDFRNR